MFSSPVPFSQPSLGRLLLPLGTALEIQWEAIAMATGLGPGFYLIKFRAEANAIEKLKKKMYSRCLLLIPYFSVFG